MYGEAVSSPLLPLLAHWIPKGFDQLSPRRTDRFAVHRSANRSSCNPKNNSLFSARAGLVEVGSSLAEFQLHNCVTKPFDFFPQLRCHLIHNCSMWRPSCAQRGENAPSRLGNSETCLVRRSSRLIVCLPVALNAPMVKSQRAAIRRPDRIAFDALFRHQLPWRAAISGSQMILPGLAGQRGGKSYPLSIGRPAQPVNPYRRKAELQPLTAFHAAAPEIAIRIRDVSDPL